MPQADGCAAAGNSVTVGAECKADDRIVRPHALVACPGRFAEGRTVFRIPYPNGVFVPRRSQAAPIGAEDQSGDSRVVAPHQACDLPSRLGVP